MYNDPSGEVFFFAALVPILGKIGAGIVAGAIAGSIVGLASYTIGLAVTGNMYQWKIGGALKSVLMGAIGGAISGGYNPGVFSSTMGTLLNMGSQVLSSLLPSWNINIGNFNFNISPSIAIGKGWGFGANVSATFHAGDFSFSAGYGLMYYGAHAGSGQKGWEYRCSGMLTYDDGKFGISLGTNKWSGLHDQRTGMIGLRHGDFSMSYENDGSPFDKIKGVNLGDGHDRWRTVAMRFGIGDFSAGLNLFTGERYSSSYESKGRIMGTWDDGMMTNYNRNKPYYKDGIRYNFGLVKEEGNRYRFGGAYIGWGNYRVGIDSDRYVRRPTQNILAHDWFSPQPGFEVLSNKINPYFQYHTKNRFTSW